LASDFLALGGEFIQRKLPYRAGCGLGDEKIGLLTCDVKVHDVAGLGKSVNKPISYHQFRKPRIRFCAGTLGFFGIS